MSKLKTLEIQDGRQAVVNSSGGIPAVIHYNNCKIYNIQTLNQTYSNKNNKRKFIIYDSSDDSQEIWNTNIKLSKQ